MSSAKGSRSGRFGAIPITPTLTSLAPQFQHHEDIKPHYSSLFPLVVAARGLLFRLVPTPHRANSSEAIKPRTKSLVLVHSFVTVKKEGEGVSILAPL